MTEQADQAPSAPWALVIDDDELVRATISSVLKKGGFEVMEAKDGNEGLKRYAERPVQVVITDILMPDKEGIETILDLRRLNPRLKIIAISGGGRIGSNHFLDLAEKMGADEVLSKPFTPERLLKTVAKCLA